MKKLFFTLIIGLLFVSPAHSQEAHKREGKKISQRQFEVINIVQDYLSKVRSFRANFIQVNPESSLISSGEIIFSKPGKLKMSYSEPFKIDYYINDNNVLQYDHDLDEVTRGEAPENPLKILLYDGVTLVKNDFLSLANVTEDANTINIFMVNKTSDLKEISGLILKFNKLPFQLSGIERVDNEGQRTETNFTAVQINTEIEDSEFVFRRPRQEFPNSR
jgi:outer membrane lipoprotein-sorting protein